MKNLTTRGKTNMTDKPLLQEAAPGSFIYEYHNALSPDDCAKMIDLFEERTDEHHSGKVAWGVERLELKRSTDLALVGQEHWAWADELFHQSILKGVGELQKIIPLFNEEAINDNGYQIQRTMPGQFYHWHKDSNRHSRKRLMVAFWYLNDIPEADGGATEFKVQNVKIQPEAGKLLFFPPYWTHIHRGCELLRGSKHIAVTWISYKGANDTDGVIHPTPDD